MKIIIKYSIPKRIRRATLYVYLVFGIFIEGCSRDRIVLLPPDNAIYSTSKYVIAGNGLYFQFEAYLNQTHLADTLASKTPFTVLLWYYNGPIYRDSAGVLSEQTVNEYIQYHLLPGLHSFNAIPFNANNQAIQNLWGTNVYVSKYLNGHDTLVTVNGIPVVQRDIATSNGFLQILSPTIQLVAQHQDNSYRDYFISPNYRSMLDLIKANKEYVYLSALLERVNLKAILEGPGPYTFFAPTNAAFADPSFNYINLHSLDSIQKVDIAKASYLLKGCIVSGRYFTADLLKDLNVGDSLILPSLNGNPIKVYKSILAYPYGDTTALLAAPGNGNLPHDTTQNFSTLEQNFPALDLGQGYRSGIPEFGMPTANGNVFFINKMLVP